jgi:hypothetical protein
VVEAMQLVHKWF